MAKKKVKRGVSIETTKKENNKYGPANSQFLVLVFIIVGIILIMLLVPIIYHDLFEKFEYAGVKFEKIAVGKIQFYYGVFPIIYMKNLTATYNLYLRIDPRKNNISVNTNLSLSENVTFSLSGALERCEDMVLSQTALGQFIKAFPWVKNINGGALELETANRTGLKQIDCRNASQSNTILIVALSEAPSISKGSRDNCYILSVGDCKYLETTERFIISAIAQINGKKI